MAEEQNEDYAPLCNCGGPMSRNPHPEAGDPGLRGLEVGTTWVCIPCMVKSRHAWARRARAAEQANYEALTMFKAVLAAAGGTVRVAPSIFQEIPLDLELRRLTDIEGGEIFNIDMHWPAHSGD